MIQKKMSSCFLAIIVLLNVMRNSGLAQSSDTPDTECTNSMLSLINCEPFLAGENVSIPPESCCAGLNDLVRAAPTCLCGIIAGNPSFSTINLSRALELPVKCGIPIDRGQCAALGAPPPRPPSRPAASQGVLEPAEKSMGSKMLVHPFIICWSAFLGGITLLSNLPPFIAE